MRRMTMLAFVACATLLCFGGCATKKIDWASRAGNYTYDQAVVELGPPDKSATLGEWYQTEEPRFSFGVGAGVSNGNVGGGIGVPIGGSGGKVLRLTFGPNGVLQPHGEKEGEVLSEPAGSSKGRVRRTDE
jgi:hypothetical protein